MPINASQVGEALDWFAAEIISELDQSDVTATSFR
jgi:hypothetical protein